MTKHQVRCDGCDKKLLFEERHVGKTVKCPVCGGAVVLMLVKATSNATSDAPKLKDSLADPFAEDAEPRIPDKIVPKEQPSRRDRNAAASKGNTDEWVPKSQSKKSPDQKLSEVPSAEIPLEPYDESVDHWSSNESGDDDSVIKSYVDELGLGELEELQMEEWAAPAKLPPAKRRPAKKAESTAPILSAASDSASTSSTVSTVKTTTAEFNATSPTSGRWLVYALFFSTLIPLGINGLMADEFDLAERINETLQQADENGVQEKIQIEEGVAITRDSLIAALPGGRLHGALLAHDSWVHWVFAGTSGIGFTVLLLMRFHRYRGALGGAVTGAIFTATIGIVLLLGLQWAAVASQGVWVRGRGFLVLLFYIVKSIGFSYRCAVDEGNGFMSSFMGFTLGVGICEELCKILPVIVYLRASGKSSWQGACLVGLASGVGFGVSEGIMYSSSYYNGISGGEIYLVRFISCVALHAVWTGAGVILLFGDQDFVHSGAEGSDMLSTWALTLGVSIVLHGLYDTLLK
jgi:RsiW-degrading membrane proteinase PrsW (M82 family)